MTPPVAPSFDGTQPCAGTDPEAWFPDPGAHNWRALDDAISICNGCPFVEPCAEWAIAHERYGIWGGLTEDNREDIRKHGRIVRTRRGVQHGKSWTYYHHKCRCLICTAAWERRAS